MRVSPERGTAGIGDDRMQLADFATFHNFPHLEIAGGVPTLCPQIKFHSIPLAGIDHCVGFLHRSTQRLIAVHPFHPVFCCKDGDFRMIARTGRYADDIGLLFLYHLPIVRILFGDIPL